MMGFKQLSIPLITKRLIHVNTRSLLGPRINEFLTVKPQLTPSINLHKRYYSVISDECRAKIYDYNDIKKLSSNPSSDIMLIDVREPIEFEQGHIPGSINIPFKSNPGALGLPAEDFEENFGFPKPEPSKELIFYCLGGVRSTAAEDLAKTFGYTKRGNYIGSYEDWITHEIKKNDPKSAATN